MENNKIQEDTIDLGKLFFAMKKKIWLILLVGLLGACGAAGYTKFFVNPTYTSTSTMLVLTKETTLASLADLQLGSQLTKDYTVLITSRPVLEEVIENLQLEMNYKVLRESISIENPADTRILKLSVINQNPKQAKAIVDELSAVSSRYIGDKMEVVPPKIIEDGELPIYKTSPSMSKNVMLGFLLGAVLVAGIIVVLELLDDTIQSEEDIEQYLGIPTLAVVPELGEHKSSGKGNKKRKNG